MKVCKRMLPLTSVWMAGVKIKMKEKEGLGERGKEMEKSFRVRNES